MHVTWSELVNVIHPLLGVRARISVPEGAS